MNGIQVELLDAFGNDRTIAECAWTSSSSYAKKKLKTNADVKKIVKMLAEQGHSVPFESVVLRFWIKMPIAIDRQVEKTRWSAQNGLSGRYRTMPSEFLAIPDDVYNITLKLGVSISKTIDVYERICKVSNDFYQETVTLAKNAEKDGKITNKEMKRMREFYRGVLPLHNMTEKVITINLLSWCNFMRLRQSEHAQPEIKDIADMMLKEVKANKIASTAVLAMQKKEWKLS